MNTDLKPRIPPLWIILYREKKNLKSRARAFYFKLINVTCPIATLSEILRSFYESSQIRNFILMQANACPHTRIDINFLEENNLKYYHLPINSDLNSIECMWGMMSRRL